MIAREPCPPSCKFMNLKYVVCVRAFFLYILPHILFMIYVYAKHFMLLKMFHLYVFRLKTSSCGNSRARRGASMRRQRNWGAPMASSSGNTSTSAT